MAVACKEAGCGRKVFAKEMCSGHYQSARRAALKGQPPPDGSKPVREYGAGHRRVSGCVNDARFVKLEKEAAAKYDGKLYRLVQDIMSVYADGLED